MGNAEAAVIPAVGVSPSIKGAWWNIPLILEWPYNGAEFNSPIATAGYYRVIVINYPQQIREVVGSNLRQVL